jgi:hypothetical protein
MAGLSSEELALRAEVRGRATWHIATFAKLLIGAIKCLACCGAALSPANPASSLLRAEPSMTGTSDEARYRKILQ